MKDDSREILNGLLADWHQWMQGYQAVAGHGTSAMFTGVRSSRQWDSESDLVDVALHNEQMKAVDFHIGELCSVYRTALCINALNLATGRSVWTSARLPTDAKQRAEVLQAARTGLICRLRDAGIV